MPNRKIKHWIILQYQEQITTSWERIMHYRNLQTSQSVWSYPTPRILVEKGQAIYIYLFQIIKRLIYQAMCITRFTDDIFVSAGQLLSLIEQLNEIICLSQHFESREAKFMLGWRSSDQPILQTMRQYKMTSVDRWSYTLPMIAQGKAKFHWPEHFLSAPKHFEKLHLFVCDRAGTSQRIEHLQMMNKSPYLSYWLNIWARLSMHCEIRSSKWLRRLSALISSS